MPEDNSAEDIKSTGEQGEGTNTETKNDAPANDGTAETKPVEDDEPQIRPRKTAKDFIIERQQKKIAKLQEKEQGDSYEDDKSEDEDDEINPDDEKVITRVLSKKLQPLFEDKMKAEDHAEVSEFIATHPEFAPYENKVRKFMQHESRRNLPIKSIFYEVAGDDLIKIGAERERKATEKAGHGSTGGGSARGGLSKNDWDMTPEEFQAKKEHIRRGQ